MGACIYILGNIYDKHWATVVAYQNTKNVRVIALNCHYFHNVHFQQYRSLYE